MSKRVPPGSRPSSSGFFTHWAEDVRAEAGLPALRPRARRWIATKVAMVLAVGSVAVVLALPGSNANADPSASDWYRLRNCESGNNYSINTGNGYYGAYQFNLDTWRSVGGTGYPNLASPGEQDARALILYRLRGWQPWTCAGIVGLREDGDARSGRISDIRIPGSGGAGGGSDAPAYPSSRSYVVGDNDPVIKRFKDQMHARGFFPVGNATYGQGLLVVVKRLQSLNGIRSSGLLGPLTWHAAWAGTYSQPPSSPPPPSADAPSFPGARSYVVGDNDPVIKRFKDQMHARGFFPVGNATYGQGLLVVVKRLQSLNGIRSSGLLGPLTWHAAWAGTYTNP